MTPVRLAECIAILGWTQRETGRQLSRQEAAIYGTTPDRLARGIDDLVQAEETEGE